MLDFLQVRLMRNYTSKMQLNTNKHVLSIRKAFAQGYFASYGEEFVPIHLHSLTQFSLSPTAHICQPAAWGEGCMLCHITKRNLVHQEESHDPPSSEIWLVIWGNWPLIKMNAHLATMELLSSSFDLHAKCYEKQICMKLHTTIMTIKLL